MKSIIWFLLLIYTHQIFSQCSGGRYLTPLFSSVQIQTLQYGNNLSAQGLPKDLFMDIYTTNGDSIQNKPLIINCFGGGFVQGARTSPDIKYISEEFAKLGYVTAAIDYRLESISNISDSLKMLKAVIRAVQDGKAAVRFLKSKSGELGIDTNKIFIGGISAGGVLSLMLAYSQLDEFHPTIQQHISDLGGYEGTTNTLPHSSKVAGVYNLSGGMADINHINLGEPPCYLNHATQDPVVPFKFGPTLNGLAKNTLYGSSPIFHKMREKGIYTKLDSFNNSNHPSFATGASGVDNIILATTRQSMIDFFYKLVCDSTNAIESNNKIEQAIYPNPASNTLKINSNNQLNRLEIYNSIGQFVLKKEGNFESVDIENLPTGLYTAILNGKNYTFLKK